MPSAYPTRTASRREARRRAVRRQRIALAAAATAVLAVGSIATWALGHLPTAVPAPVTAATPEPAAPSETTVTAESVASPQPTETPLPSRPATVTIAAVGDMHFDRQVRQAINRWGATAPLRHVADRLAAADIAVGNLESTLSDLGERNAEKDYTFKGDPRGVEGLALAGFDFLSLANNHALDAGSEAMLDTIARLDANNIGHAGAGADKTAAWTPAVHEVNGVSVAFFGFSHILPAGFVATDSSPGIARGRGNMDSVEAAIRSAKEQYDYVIVSFHWGVEKGDNANGDQVADAHRAVDAGADMVLSHHPHVIQAIEYYNGRLIAYSLGDFVFDHYSRKTGEAFILEADLGPAGVANARVVPVYLDDTYGVPDYVSGREATVILERLKTLSAARRTTVAIDGDTARILP
ncbi:MAG: CapA family protein [Actinomycetota bacterium]